MRYKRYITAEELNHLFHQPIQKKRPPVWPLVSAAFIITFGIFTLMNAPAMSQQFRYWWETDIQAAQNNQRPNIPPVNPVPTGQPTPAAEPSQPVQSTPITVKTAKAFDPQSLADNSISIPRIKAKAPIIWDASAGGDINSDILKALERGVVRYPQTALPNQVGNVFLTGHSSNYWWEKGQYKTVFVLLNRLVAGDVIYVKYQNTVYTYTVVGQKTVKPTDTSVLAPTSQPVLTLMTCTPTGTSLYRRIVTATLVGPTENLKPQPTQPNASALQSIR